MRNITYRRMKNAVQHFVNEDPNFIYDSELGCFYIRDNEPSCLIGKALHKMGVSKQILKELDTGSNGIACAVHDKPFIDILLDHGWEIDEQALEFADHVQECQDNGSKWKKAFDEGVKHFE